jgi:hypothetical protein
VNRGKLVVVTIFLIALAAAVFAWIYQLQRTRQALRFWGSHTAQLIRRAPKVELWRLSPESAPGTQLLATLDDQSWHVLERKDISRAAGLVNARAALVQDASFDFHAPRGECRPHWAYAVRFEGEGGEALVAVDFQCRRIRSIHEEREAAMSEKLASGLRRFFEEQFESAASKPP